MTLRHIRTPRGRRDAMVAAYKRSVAPSKLPNAKTQTIAQLIAWYVGKHGEAPKPEWLASTCGMALERVKQHLEVLGR